VSAGRNTEDPCLRSGRRATPIALAAKDNRRLRNEAGDCKSLGMSHTATRPHSRIDHEICPVGGGGAITSHAEIGLSASSVSTDAADDRSFPHHCQYGDRREKVAGQKGHAAQLCTRHVCDERGCTFQNHGLGNVGRCRGPVTGNNAVRAVGG
jgi:hypothetical protein